MKGKEEKMKRYEVKTGAKGVTLRKLAGVMGVTALFAVATGCSMINDDLAPCAPDPDVKTRVSFVYDYNMQYADLLTDHVGSVYLYVFNSKGIYQTRRELHRADMGDNIDFTMEFDSTELKPGHTYQFVAMAQANHVGYTQSLETPGFTLVSEMIPGVSSIEDYRIKLDRDDDGTYDFGIVDYRDAYGNTETMIDTVWTTKPDEVQIASIPSVAGEPSPIKRPDELVEVTIPLMRITNSITVNLLHPQFNENTNVDDYNIVIHFPNGNGTIDFTGTTYSAQELYYRALRKNVVARNAGTRAIGDYAIQSVFGVSRMQVTDGSSLQIRDAHTNEILAKIDNFSAFLTEYFEHGFDDPQEFLDREYDFTVDVALNQDDEIIYVILSIIPLNWSVRINFVNL